MFFVLSKTSVALWRVSFVGLFCVLKGLFCMPLVWVCFVDVFGDVKDLCCVVEGLFCSSLCVVKGFFCMSLLWVSFMDVFCFQGPMLHCGGSLL